MRLLCWGLGVNGGSHERPGFFGTMQYGFYRLKYWMNYTADSLRMLVTGQVGLQDLSGPVGIVAVVDDVYESAAPSGILTIVLSLMNFGTLLSANLGVMNLLPIPALGRRQACISGRGSCTPQEDSA